MHRGGFCPSAIQRIARNVDFFRGTSRKRQAARARQERAKIERLAAELASPTNASAQPNSLATAIALRDVANLRANSKMFAAYIAETDLQFRVSSIAVDEPNRIGPRAASASKAISLAPWFLYWVKRLKVAPRLHRKLWEDAYVVQCFGREAASSPARAGSDLRLGWSLYRRCSSVAARGSRLRISPRTTSGAAAGLDPSTRVKYRGARKSQIVTERSS